MNQGHCVPPKCWELEASWRALHFSEQETGKFSHFIKKKAQTTQKKRVYTVQENCRLLVALDEHVVHHWENEDIVNSQ